MIDFGKKVKSAAESRWTAAVLRKPVLLKQMLFFGYFYRESPFIQALQQNFRVTQLWLNMKCLFIITKGVMDYE